MQASDNGACLELDELGHTLHLAANQMRSCMLPWSGRQDFMLCYRCAMCCCLRLQDPGTMWGTQAGLGYSETSSTGQAAAAVLLPVHAASAPFGGAVASVEAKADVMAVLLELRQQLAYQR